MALEEIQIDVVKGRAEAIGRLLDVESARRLMEQARRVTGGRRKLIWLHRAQDLLGSAVDGSGVSPCKRGCSHCCHQAVQMSRAEARLIAEVTGERLNAEPLGGIDVAGAAGDGEELGRVRRKAELAYSGQPCPFLGGDGSCRVYEVRPIACRLHFSLADDDSPCRLEGQGGETGADVPYLQVMPWQIEALAVLGMGQKVADVREWFPDFQYQSIS